MTEHLNLRCKSIPPERCGVDDFFRASGDVECPRCAAPYWDHPYCSNSKFEDWYTVNVICGGQHVKL